MRTNGRLLGALWLLSSLDGCSLVFDASKLMGMGALPDAGGVDAGGVDAGDVDAGDVDAGDLDAGDLDAGDMDAGCSLMTCPDGACADLDKDPLHCGSCDVRCGLGQQCSSGECGEPFDGTALVLRSRPSTEFSALATDPATGLVCAVGNFKQAGSLESVAGGGSAASLDPLPVFDMGTGFHSVVSCGAAPLVLGSTPPTGMVAGLAEGVDTVTSLVFGGRDQLWAAGCTNPSPDTAACELIEINFDGGALSVGLRIRLGGARSLDALAMVGPTATGEVCVAGTSQGPIQAFSGGMPTGRTFPMMAADLAGFVACFDVEAVTAGPTRVVTARTDPPSVAPLVFGLAGEAGGRMFLAGSAASSQTVVVQQFVWNPATPGFMSGPGMSTRAMAAAPGTVEDDAAFVVSVPSPTDPSAAGWALRGGENSQARSLSYVFGEGSGHLIVGGTCGTGFSIPPASGMAMDSVDACSGFGPGGGMGMALDLDAATGRARWAATFENCVVRAVAARGSAVLVAGHTTTGSVAVATSVSSSIGRGRGGETVLPAPVGGATTGQEGFALELGLGDAVPGRGTLLGADSEAPQGDTIGAAIGVASGSDDGWALGGRVLGAPTRFGPFGELDKGTEPMGLFLRFAR